VKQRRNCHFFHCKSNSPLFIVAKDNKVKYLQQMGEWYVQPVCVGTGPGQDVSAEACCSADALVTCHYRDKPSKIPCKSSPNIDKGKPSFWK
jgi:hypothetical protein